MDYNKIKSEYKIDKEIKKIIKSLNGYAHELKDLPELKEYLPYFIKLPGRRKRLIKLIAFSKICGDLNENIRHIINALEFSNAAVFIDDDVIDHDSFRKGRPTLNNLIGFEKTLLIGNMLFILSLREIQKIKCDLELKEEIMQDFSKSLFIENCGQYMDMSFKNNFKNKNLGDWEKMIIRNSGSYVISALKAIAKINHKNRLAKIIENYEKNCTLAGAAEDALIGFIGKEKISKDLENKNFTILISYSNLKEDIKEKDLNEKIIETKSEQKTRQYIELKVNKSLSYIDKISPSFDREVLKFLVEELRGKNE